MSRGTALRALRVDGERYLWKVEHSHFGARRCRETFTAFAEGRKASPIRVRFDDDSREGRHAGYPEKGVVWTSREPKRSANLNTPRVAAKLVREGRRHGWSPETSKTPFVVDEGFAWLTEETPV